MYVEDIHSTLISSPSTCCHEMQLTPGAGLVWKEGEFLFAKHGTM